MEQPEAPGQPIDIDVEQTRLLALTTNLRQRMAEKPASPSEGAEEVQWTGKEIYDYMAANRNARFEKTEDGIRNFKLMKEYMQTRNHSWFAGIMDAVGSMVDELGGLKRAPELLFDKDKSLGYSAAEGFARGVRDIATIVAQSEDPNSWAFNVKSWVKALNGSDDGDTIGQMDQYHVARDWNNRTYDYMEGKATLMGDIFSDQKDFYQRAIDPKFATAFSWIATDIPEWIFSGGVATVGSAVKGAAKAGVGAAGRLSAKEASFLGASIDRIGRFAAETSGKATYLAGRAVLKPFELLYGTRAAMDAVAGRAATAAAENIATSQILEMGAEVIGGSVKVPAMGVFRSLGLEAVGEVMVALGSEMGERAMGVSRFDPARASSTALQAVASNLGGAASGKLSKEALALAKGLNYTLGWLPSMSTHAMAEAARNSVVGGILGYYHSEEAIGQGIGIGAAYGAGFGTLRHAITYTHYGHQDKRIIGNFDAHGIAAIERVMGADSANDVREWHKDYKGMIAPQLANGTRFHAIEIASLSHMAVEGSVAQLGGAPGFMYGNYSTPDSKVIINQREFLVNKAGYERLVKEGWSPTEAAETMDSMRHSKGTYLEPQGVFSSDNARRMILINKDMYTGLSLNHEISHKVFRKASFNSQNTDAEGLYNEAYMKRVLGALHPDVVDVLGTTYFGLVGFREAFPTGQRDPQTNIEIVDYRPSKKSYRSLLQAEVEDPANGVLDPNTGILDPAKFAEYEKQHTSRIQQQAYNDAVTGPAGKSKVRQLLDDLFDPSGSALDKTGKVNLTRLVDELLAYHKGAYDMALPPDYWSKNKVQKDILEALGEWAGMKRHTRTIEDMELAGVFVKERLRKAQEAGSPLIIEEGVPFIEAYARDGGQIVRMESFDNMMREIYDEAANYTEQPVHTLSPAMQQVVARMSGKERYFRSVNGGMQLKPKHEREQIATDEAKRLIAALDALPDVDKPKASITPTGISIKLEELSQAGWKAIESSGVITPREYHELVAMAKIINDSQTLSGNSQNHNTLRCSLGADTRQVGRVGTAARLRGEDVPVTHRVFLPLSIELYLNNKNKDGTPARTEKGAITVHSLDILVENKRLISLYEKPHVRQHFANFTEFVDFFWDYVKNNSQPPGSRVSSVDLIMNKMGFSKEEAVAIRDIFFEAFGGRKKKGDSYINTPGEHYVEPGDNRLYPFYSMRFETMFDIELKPIKWNPNATNAVFPYVHQFGYEPQTRNAMVTGFSSFNKANGKYLRNRDGFEIHAVKGKYRMFDQFGNKVGDFESIDRAITKAAKLGSKIDEAEIVPAAVDAASVQSGLNYSATKLAMEAAYSSKLRDAYVSNGMTDHDAYMAISTAAGIAKGSSDGSHLSGTSVIPLYRIYGHVPAFRYETTRSPDRGPRDNKAKPYGTEVFSIRLTESMPTPDAPVRKAPGGFSVSVSGSSVLLEISKAEFEALPAALGGTDKAMQHVNDMITHAMQVAEATINGQIPQRTPSEKAFSDSARLAATFIGNTSKGLFETATTSEGNYSANQRKLEADAASREGQEEISEMAGALSKATSGAALLPESEHKSTMWAVYGALVSADSSNVLIASLTKQKIPLGPGLLKLNAELLKHEDSLGRQKSESVSTGSDELDLKSLVDQMTDAEIDDLGVLFTKNADGTILEAGPFDGSAFIWSHTKDKNALAALLHDKLLGMGVLKETQFQAVHGGPMVIKEIRKRLKDGTLATRQGRELAEKFSGYLQRVKEKAFAIRNVGVGKLHEGILRSIGAEARAPLPGFPIVVSVIDFKNKDMLALYGMDEITSIIKDPNSSPELVADAFLIRHYLEAQAKATRFMHELKGQIGRDPTLGNHSELNQRVALLARRQKQFEKGDPPGMIVSLDEAKTRGFTLNVNFGGQDRLREYADSNQLLVSSDPFGKNEAVEIFVSADTKAAFEKENARHQSSLSVYININGRLSNAMATPASATSSSTGIGAVPKKGAGKPLARTTTSPGAEFPRAAGEPMRQHPAPLVGRPSVIHNMLFTHGIRKTQSMLSSHAAKNSQAMSESLIRMLGKGEEARALVQSAVQEAMVELSNPQAPKGRSSAKLTAAFRDAGMTMHEHELGHAIVDYAAATEALARDPQARIHPGLMYSVDLQVADSPEMNKASMRFTKREDAYARVLSLVAEMSILHDAKIPGFVMPETIARTVRIFENSAFGAQDLRGAIKQFGPNGYVFVATGMTGTYATQMVVGQSAIRRMTEMRRDELQRRGLLKMMKLGDGTSHLVTELADDKATLALHKFGDRLANIAFQASGDDPAEAAKLWLASKGHVELRQEYAKKLGTGGMALRAYYGALPADAKKQISEAGLDMAIEAKLEEMVSRANARKPKLSDILDHPDLYELYPNIPDMPIEFMRGFGMQMNGPDGIIRIGIDLLIRDEIADLNKVIELPPESKASLSLDQHTPSQGRNSYAGSIRAVLLHEIQHAVQHAEKWGMVTPWLSKVIKGGTVLGFESSVDTFVAVEKVMGGKKKSKILSNIDSNPSKPPADVSDRLMQTWGNLQEIVSLDKNAKMFMPLATEAEAAGVLKSILQTPKAVQLIDSALPNYLRFLHELAINADMHMDIRRSAGDYTSSEMVRLSKTRNLLGDSIAKVEQVKKDMIGGMPFIEAMSKIAEIHDAVTDAVPSFVQDPVWGSGVNRKTLSSYNAGNDVRMRGVEVAAQLAEIASSVEPGEVVTPAKAQLLIVKLMNEMKDLFYSASDTEFMARETAKRSLMSQAELESSPRALDYFDPANVGMYDHAKWAKDRGFYSLDMIGGLAGSPEITTNFGPGGGLNHFAAAIRLAARATLHGIHIRSINEAATRAGVLDFSSRGWVMEDGRLVYRIATGRLEGLTPESNQMLLRGGSEGFNEIVLGVTDPQQFSGVIQRDASTADSKDVAMLGFISADGKNITIEDVGRLYGANVAYEGITDTESPVMNYLMKDDGPQSYTGGTIKNTLALAGLSEDSMRMANVDHVDKAFSGVNLSRYELLDLLATVHNVTLESTSFSPADKGSVSIRNLTLIKDKAEAGRRLWSSAQHDAATRRAAAYVLSEVLGGDAREELLTAQFSTENMGGAMFMMRTMQAHVRFASNQLWTSFLKNLSEEQRENFMKRVQERVGDVQSYPRGGWQPGVHNRAYVALIKAVMTGSEESARDFAQAKLDAMNAHIMGLLIAITPAAEKVWKTLEQSRLRGEEMPNIGTTFADVVADMTIGAMQGSDVWNIHLSERGTGQTRYVTGLEQIYAGARLEYGARYHSLGNTPVGAPVRTSSASEHQGGYTSGFYRQIRRSAEEIGSQIPTMTTGGLPQYGTITSAAGDLYRQFATGTYVGSAFGGDVFGANQFPRLTERSYGLGTPFEGDLSKLAAQADRTDLKGSVGTIERYASTSGIRTKFQTPEMTVHETEQGRVYQTPSLKEKGVGFSFAEDVLDIRMPEDAADRGMDIAGISPIKDLHALSLIEIAAARRSAGYQAGLANVGARANEMAIPMALLEFRNAGYRMIDAAQQYLNFAESLSKRLYTARDEATLNANIPVQTTGAAEGIPAGSLNVSEFTSLGDPAQVNELLLKAKAFHQLAHLIQYKGDNFGMMDIIPSHGSDLVYLPHNWDNPQEGTVTETMGAEARGFALPTSNTSMVRGLIDDKSSPGSKTMLITAVSSLAEPPTAADVGLVDSAFARDSQKQKAEVARSAIPVIRNISFDLNTSYTDNEHPYQIGRTIYARDARYAPSLKAALEGDAATEIPSSLPRQLSSVTQEVVTEPTFLRSPVLREILASPLTGAVTIFDQAFYTQLGHGHLVGAMTGAATFGDNARGSPGRALIQTIKSHSDLATDWLKAIADMTAANTTLTPTQIAQEAWKKVYKGRKIKYDPRILIFARPISDSPLFHHNFLRQIVPGFEQALNNANIAAQATMAVRHLRDMGSGEGIPTLSAKEAIDLARSNISDSGGRFPEFRALTLMSHFINRDLATTDGFIRYNNLVGDMFLENTLIGWLGQDAGFLGHIEDVEKARMIMALRFASTAGNPFQYSGFKSSTLHNATDSVKKTIFGVDPSTAGTATYVRAALREMADSLKTDGHVRDVAAAIPAVMDVLSNRKGVSLNRPLSMADNKPVWHLNDVLARTGDAFGDESVKTLRARPIPHTGSRYDFHTREFIPETIRDANLTSTRNVHETLFGDELLYSGLISEVWSVRPLDGGFGVPTEPTFYSYYWKKLRAIGQENTSTVIRTGEHRRVMRESSPFVSAKPVSIEEGGSLYAMVHDSMSADELTAGMESAGANPTLTVTPQTPRTTISESTARASLHQSIQSRIAAEGVDSVDIAPASSIFGRVLPDVVQKRFQLAHGSGVKDLEMGAVLSSRGLMAAAKTISRPYGESRLTGIRRDNDAIAPRLRPPALSGTPAAEGTLAGFANPYSLTGQPYHKGYAWNVQPDGSILLNISGDHLGYKTGLLKDVWGFSLAEGVGYDPHSTALIPMRYDLHVDLHDIMSRVKHSMAPMLDPRDAAVDRARVLAGRDYHRRPLSEIRMQILNHPRFQQYVESAAGGTSSRMSALDDPINFGQDIVATPEITAGMITGQYAQADFRYRSQVVAAGVLGGLQTASYLTIKIPAGSSPEVIKAMILSAHTDLALQKGIVGTATTVPRFGFSAPYHDRFDNPSAPSSGNRRFGGKSEVGEGNLLQDTMGYQAMAGMKQDAFRANLEIALQLDPKLIEDVEVLVGRIASSKSSYFLPETERVLRVHGDTGAAVSTLFPGRPDLEKFAWDAKASRDIKVWKRSLPRGARPETHFQHVVQFNSPIGMTVEGSVALGPNAIAFRTPGEAEAFANRMSMQTSKSDLVRALSTGEAEIVSRPQDMDSDLVVPAKVMSGHTIIWDTPGRNESVVSSEQVGLKIGDSELAPGTDAKSARLVAGAIGKNKHIRFSAAPITLQMAMGLTTERDFRDLVTAKANFGLPLGPARFASKAMQVITEGVLRANGAFRTFTELSGPEWLKLMKENGVGKDEIRQSGLGALFINAGTRKLSRLEVAEFFAHMYPVLVRNDFSVNERLRGAGKAYIQRGANARGYAFASPDHVAVSIGNQMMALTQLERRRQQLNEWLTAAIEKGTPVDDSSVQSVKKTLEAFDRVYDEILVAYGRNPEHVPNRTDELKRVVMEGARREEGMISPVALIQQKVEDIRQLSFAPYEKARMELNAILSAEVIAERHREELGPLFADLGPAIEHALTLKNSALFTADEIKSITGLTSEKSMGETANGGIPYYDNRPLKDSIMSGVREGQGPRIGQYMGNNDYWHAHYVSGAVHSQFELIVDYASTAEVEIQQFINEKNTQILGMPEGADKEKLVGIVQSAKSVLAARMAQRALGNNRRGIGSGHFAEHIGGLYSPLGRYEASHVRQSHVLATGRPTLIGMIKGIGGLGVSGLEGTSPLVDPLATSSKFGLEPIAESLTVIEEVQSDAFQKLDEVTELTPGVDSTMLPVDPSDLTMGPRMEAAKRLSEDIQKLRTAIERGDDLVVTKLMEDIAGIRSSSFLNIVRRNAIESIDLVSRQYMVPAFPGMLRSTGRKVRMGEHMKRKLESMGMKFTDPEPKVSVFDFDFELLDEIGRYGNIGAHPVGEHATKLRARIRENLVAGQEMGTFPGMHGVGVSFKSLAEFDAAPDGKVFNFATKLCEAINESVINAGAQQSSEATTKLLVGLKEAADAAAAVPGAPRHLTKFINGIVGNSRNLSPIAKVQGLLAGVISTDPVLNAMLRQIADNPDSFDYEALARRSVEVVRAKFSDTKGVLTRSALTTLDKLLLIPAQDAPRRQSIEVDEPIAGLVDRNNLTRPLDAINRALTAGDQAGLSAGLVDFLQTTGKAAMLIAGRETTDLSLYPDFRILIPIQGSKGDGFRMTGTKDYVALSVNSADQVAALMLETEQQGVVGPNGPKVLTFGSRSEASDLLLSSFMAFDPPYRGSMAGDMAKMVAHHLSGYERATDMAAKLAGMEAKYAESTKGLPEPVIHAERAVSASTPFIESNLTWYKSASINHSIIESINRGQRSIGLLDGAYQMTRGGSLQRTGTMRVSVGAERMSYGLQVEGTGASKVNGGLNNVLLALCSVDGEIKWQPEGFCATQLRKRPALELIGGAPIEFRGLRESAITHVVRELMELANAKLGLEAVKNLVSSDETLMRLATGQPITDQRAIFLLNRDELSRPNVGPDGKPVKFSERERAYKPYQQIVINSDMYSIPEGWSHGSVAVGYTLNYGLRQNAINMLFPGVSRKVTDVFNLDAFERPDVSVDGETIIVRDKAGREVHRANVRDMADQRAMTALREAVLKNSKYVGGNIYLKTFLKEWGPAGGYVDSMVAGRGLNPGSSGKMNTPASLVASGVAIPATHATGLDVRGRAQYERLGEMGVAPSRVDEGLTSEVGEYASTGTSTRGEWSATSQVAKILHQSMGIPLESGILLQNMPMFTVMTHTPMTRTPAELKAYSDKLKNGVFLQMVTGTDALARKDSKSMRRVARYLAASGHIPRLRAMQDEDEQR